MSEGLHAVYRPAKGVERDAARAASRAPDSPQPFDAAKQRGDARLGQRLGEEVGLGKERYARQIATGRRVAGVHGFAQFASSSIAPRKLFSPTLTKVGATPTRWISLSSSCAGTGHRADEAAADADGRRAAEVGGQVHVGPQRVGLVRRPRLPALHHVPGVRPSPAEAEQDQLAQVVSAERERGGDAEVTAAAASAGPVQAPVAVVATGRGGAVGEHDVERPEIVARQSVDAGQHADAAAESQAGDADGRAGPAGHGPAARCQPAVEVDQVDAGADGDCVGPEAHRVHFGDVDDQAAGDAGPAAVAMAARPGADRELNLVTKLMQAATSALRLAVGDAGRLQRVELRAEQLLGEVVAGLAGPQELMGGQLPPQRVPVRIRWRGVARRYSQAGRADAVPADVVCRCAATAGPKQPAGD